MRVGGEREGDVDVYYGEFVFCWWCFVLFGEVVGYEFLVIVVNRFFVFIYQSCEVMLGIVIKSIDVIEVIVVYF